MLLCPMSSSSLCSRPLPTSCISAFCIARPCFSSSASTRTSLMGSEGQKKEEREGKVGREGEVQGRDFTLEGERWREKGDKTEALVLKRGGKRDTR